MRAKSITFTKRTVHKLLGSTPWYPGYNESRIAFLEAVLSNNRLMERFRLNARLPEGYGIGLDERVVEYPWLLSRLLAHDRTILDAGATLNHSWLLGNKIFEDKCAVIYTLAPEMFVAKDARFSYVYGDLRNTLLRDDAVDVTVCISTLEHVGMDNTEFYSKDAKYAENHKEDYLKVVDELCRVTKPDGTIFISVPFGREQNHGWFQQFTNPMLDKLLARANVAEIDLTFYRYTDRGWNLATRTECESCEYFDFHRDGRIRNKDLAAAARAVACMKLRKSLA